MKPIPLVIMKDIDLHFPGVLRATGAVGTRFILLLAQNPLLELVAVGASEHSADKNTLMSCVGSSRPQCPPKSQI